MLPSHHTAFAAPDGLKPPQSGLHPVGTTHFLRKQNKNLSGSQGNIGWSLYKLLPFAQKAFSFPAALPGRQAAAHHASKQAKGETKIKQRLRE